MFTVVAVLLLLLLWLISLWWYLLGIGLFTAALYAYDKYAACRGWRRVPEIQLLTAALAGGAICALFIMFAIHHKTRKTAILLPVLLLAIAQMAAIFWLT